MASVNFRERFRDKSSIVGKRGEIDCSNLRPVELSPTRFPNSIRYRDSSRSSSKKNISPLDPSVDLSPSRLKSSNFRKNSSRSVFKKQIPPFDSSPRLYSDLNKYESLDSRSNVPISIENKLQKYKPEIIQQSRIKKETYARLKSKLENYSKEANKTLYRIQNNLQEYRSAQKLPSINNKGLSNFKTDRSHSNVRTTLKRAGMNSVQNY